MFMYTQAFERKKWKHMIQKSKLANDVVNAVISKLDR